MSVQSIDSLTCATQPGIYTWEEVEAAVREGSLIADGVLNRAYRVVLRDEIRFVRSRTFVGDPGYAQKFAAERFLPLAVHDQLRIPCLLETASDNDGRERFAVFEFIECTHATWGTHIGHCVVEGLLVVHAQQGSSCGSITQQEQPPGDTYQFILSLFVCEIERVRRSSRLTARELSQLSQVITWLPRYRQQDICLCHGDVRSANLLLDTDGQLWFADWEAARYRVAASDFNQLRFDGVDDVLFESMLSSYCAATGRNKIAFKDEVDAFRVLWHLRTYNFESDVVGRGHDATAHHIARAMQLVAEHGD